MDTHFTVTKGNELSYNEEENIEKVDTRIINEYSRYDYVVANDGSKDRTVAIKAC